jgi:hypothetical protein
LSSLRQNLSPMPQTFTSPARTTQLDEHAFEQLLAAAFVIQEHNQRQEPKPRIEQPAARRLDFTKAVSATSALQEEIAPGLLDLPASARLIAERALQVMSAQGVTVGIVVDEFLTYIGTAGTAAGDGGRKFPVAQSLPATCIRQSQPLQYSNPDSMPRAFAGKSELQSLIAAPVIQKGIVLGILELRFSTPRDFSAEEIRAAELFAGAVNLAITTAAKKHVAEIRDTAPPAAPVSSVAVATPPPEPTAPAPTPAAQDAASDPEAEETLCEGCGRVLFAWESFCARCGSTKNDHANHTSAREAPAAEETEETSSGSDLTAELDHSWGEDAATPSSLFGSGSADHTQPQIDASLEQVPPAQPVSSALAVADSIRIVPADPPPAEEAEEAIEATQPWSSAQNARNWFEGLREHQGSSLSRLEELWQSQRANIWLGAASLVLLFTLIQFIASPTAPRPATANSAPATTPQLSFFEGLLVSLGLAEAPPAPAVSFAGNPEARVWVDTRTALYYCEGTGQYGKTPGGKFTSQRDAQQDQFEPAHRKVCP